MRYLTERKRAVGKGASGRGTEHHWKMQVSAVCLALIIPSFIYLIGTNLGASRQELLETFSHPFPAILSAVVLIASLSHFRNGAQIMIEDYWRGTLKKILLITVNLMSHGLTIIGLYALAKMAL